MSIKSVVGSTSSQIILSETEEETRGAAIYNNTNKNMYVAFEDTASAQSFTVILTTSTYWEIPESYTGVVSAIWSPGVSGNALITTW